MKVSMFEKLVLQALSWILWLMINPNSNTYGAERTQKEIDQFLAEAVYD